MMRAIGYNTSDGSVFVEATPVPLLKEGEVLIKVMNNSSSLFNLLYRLQQLVLIVLICCKYKDDILHLLENPRYLELRVTYSYSKQLHKC